METLVLDARAVILGYTYVDTALSPARKRKQTRGLPQKTGLPASMIRRNPTLPPLPPKKAS
jgi:hypothetical protein